MASQGPPSHSKSNKATVLLLVGGFAILAVAGIILYVRRDRGPAPAPEPPPVVEMSDIPAPLVVPQKKPPIQAREDGGLEPDGVPTAGRGKRPPQKLGAATGKTGTIDGKAVNRYINTRFGQVRTCYERRLKKNPLLEGLVDLNITISTKGKASGISVNKDTVRDPQMIDCIKGVIRGWKFPQPEGGKVVIAKQFTFKKKV